MFENSIEKHLVPYDGGLHISDLETRPDATLSEKKAKKRLKKFKKEIAESQRLLFAQDQYAILLIFQAMDAAGKDSTIRHVLSGVNPAGCQVTPFRQPSSRELDHDFLWRTTKTLPERGRIGVFNRSYYEEVLVVRVHPEFLLSQKLPEQPVLHELWEQRYDSIRAHEAHLARNGVIILKFWLNVSKEEQKQRFLERINNPKKRWKFSLADIHERRLWGHYMDAYEQMLNATSRPWAPWFSIPADDKPYMRYRVAKTIAKTLDTLNLRYPDAEARDGEKYEEFRDLLSKEA
ncbi:MAG: PPK2 family polyphosphate kinase [Thiotrichales bacterium]